MRSSFFFCSFLLLSSVRDYRYSIFILIIMMYFGWLDIGTRFALVQKNSQFCACARKRRNQFCFDVVLHEFEEVYFVCVDASRCRCCRFTFAGSRTWKIHSFSFVRSTAKIRSAQKIFFNCVQLRLTTSLFLFVFEFYRRFRADTQQKKDLFFLLSSTFSNDVFTTSGIGQFSFQFSVFDSDFSTVSSTENRFIIRGDSSKTMINFGNYEPSRLISLQFIDRMIRMNRIESNIERMLKTQRALVHRENKIITEIFQIIYGCNSWEKRWLN